MNCKIISPNNTITYHDLLSVTLPGYSGEMQILPQHAESFIRLQKGEIVLEQSNGKKEFLKIQDGECYFDGGTATIIL